MHFKNEEGDPKGVLTSEGVVYVNPGEELEYEEYNPEERVKKPKGRPKKV